MNIHKMLELALYESRKVIGYRYCHGCVIFDKNSVITAGHNKQRYHPQLRQYGYKRNCWLHAESDALLKCLDIDLTKATLLVVRRQKTKYSTSRPCSCCMAMIRERKLKRVIYTDTTGGLVIVNLKYPQIKLNIEKWEIEDFPLV